MKQNITISDINQGRLADSFVLLNPPELKA